MPWRSRTRRWRSRRGNRSPRPSCRGRYASPCSPCRWRAGRSTPTSALTSFARGGRHRPAAAARSGRPGRSGRRREGLPDRGARARRRRLRGARPDGGQSANQSEQSLRATRQGKRRVDTGLPGVSHYPVRVVVPAVASSNLVAHPPLMPVTRRRCSRLGWHRPGRAAPGPPPGSPADNDTTHRSTI